MEKLTTESVYNYANFNGIKFPTTKLSANGKDKESYLETLSLDDNNYKFSICVNFTKGIATVTRV